MAVLFGQSGRTTCNPCCIVCRQAEMGTILKKNDPKNDPTGEPKTMSVLRFCKGREIVPLPIMRSAAHDSIRRAHGGSSHTRRLHCYRRFLRDAVLGQEREPFWACRVPFWKSRILWCGLVMVLTKKAKIPSAGFTEKSAMLLVAVSFPCPNLRCQPQTSRYYWTGWAVTGNVGVVTTGLEL